LLLLLLLIVLLLVLPKFFVTLRFEVDCIMNYELPESKQTHSCCKNKGLFMNFISSSHHARDGFDDDVVSYSYTIRLMWFWCR